MNPDISRWEQRYREGNIPWDRDTPDPHLIDALERWAPPSGEALVIGCGTGINALHLVERGFEVTGLDVAPKAIEMARARAEAAGQSLTLQAGDFLTEALAPRPFEFIWDRGCFHSFRVHEERALYAALVAQRLKPEGLWISLIGSTDGPPREEGPPRLSAADIARAVEPHLEILCLEAIRFGTDGVYAWRLVTRKRGRYPR